VAVDRGVTLGSSEVSGGPRVGMMEVIVLNDNLLAGTASPGENEEKEWNDRDMKVGAWIGVDNSNDGDTRDE
jgi:hypothetical protein